MEENSITSDGGSTHVISENPVPPETKNCKLAKAGEKAQKEVINSWRENGFSRLAPMLTTVSCKLSFFP